MSTDRTYNIVYDMHLRHRIRHELTNPQCRMLSGTYDIVFDVNFLRYTISYVQPTMSYVTPKMLTNVRHRIDSYVICRMYDVEYDIVRPTYDVVGVPYDIIRRRTISHLARIQMAASP